MAVELPVVGKAAPSSPAGICESCTEIRNGNSVDVIEIDAATNRGIDEIRELREAARYRRRSVTASRSTILDEAHQITDAAFTRCSNPGGASQPRRLYDGDHAARGYSADHPLAAASTSAIAP